MPSANHLSTVTTFSDWSHADRVAIDESEASAAWAAIQNTHLEDQDLHGAQERNSVASISTQPRGWYGPHVSRYPPPPPRPPIPVPRPTTILSTQEVLPSQLSSSSYVTPYVEPSSSYNNHYIRRRSVGDDASEEFPPRNDPLTPRKMGGDVPYPYNSTGSFSAAGFQLKRDSLSPYPPSGSSTSSGDQPLKMPRRSGLVLSAASTPLIEYKDEQFPEYKYQANDLVEVFIVITKINGRDIPRWIMGTVNSSDILPGWTATGDRIYDIRYRIKYYHPQNPSTEIWGIFSNVEIRRLVPRLSNTPWPVEGTLLFVRTKIFDASEGKPRSTWFPCDYGVIAFVGDYTNAVVPSDSRFRSCTEKALNEMRRDGSRLLFPWSDFDEFLGSIERPVFRS
ncbi:hypothetical protein CVT25_004257 [Psilocybe cyanescens]|uniref:Uncharacterized protein n=1 Tax=Psilocybe cyanescens TaxID=93625 RepID=A0A409WXJ3_PSICY|nr:hypothetical protein CVT25_004257 [Psilocybe cyanescens]